MTTLEIPLAPLDRLLRKTGAKRVSSSAAGTLKEILANVSNQIATRALELSKHANRSTVTDEDIKLAYKQWLAKH